MTYRLIGTASAVALAAALVLSPFTSAAQSNGKVQSKGKWTAPKTADGVPDLQGIWTNITITPLERPREMAEKAFFTPEEARAYENRFVDQNNADKRSSKPLQDVGTAYNAFWYDRGTRVVPSLRTSLIVDPPDGRVPPLTADGERRQAARAAQRQLQGPADGPESRSLPERCLVWPTAGPPMMPSFYNNNYQIVQGPGYVAILVEMIHDVRIIPTDNRPHLPAGVEQWLGDSRGHWEGNTLVVETTNFSPKSTFRGATEKMKLTERFTRVSPDQIDYQYTVDDPATFTKPWRAEVPMLRYKDSIYEYACHEGNYAMTDMLAGARLEEKKAAEAAGKR